MKGCIYLLTHSQDFPFIAYIGQTVNPKNRKSSHLNGHAAAHNWKFRKFIAKFGINSLSFEIIWEGDSSLLDEMETAFIEKYKKIYGEQSLFNITNGGEGIDPETARINAQKRLDDGSHPFLQKSFIEKTKERNRELHKKGGLEPMLKARKELNIKQVQDGSHHFMNNDFSKQRKEKRVSNGVPYIVAYNDEKCIIFWEAKEIQIFGFNLAHVISVCKGRLKTHKGYKFKYHPLYAPKKASATHIF